MMGMKIRATLVVLLVIASSIFLFMSTATLNETFRTSSTSRTLPPLSCGQNLQLLRNNSTRGGDGVTTQGASGIGDRVFDETVEFSRRSASLLQSAIRLHASFTPWWFNLSGNDVTFNQGQQKRK